MSQHDHYFIDVSAYDRVDVYRLIELAGITCPVAQHVFKKAFATGKRGHKDLRRDWQDMADSAGRKLQMLDEDAAISKANMDALGGPAAFGLVERCTCPSGDGSLRWPCPAHPPGPAFGRHAEGADVAFQTERHLFIATDANRE